MNSIQRRPRARLDLIDIWQFIADDSVAAADRVLDGIESTLRMLRDNPKAGRARPELAEGLRSFPAGAYVLFYRQGPNGIEFVRALSGYRDVQPESF